jgi:lipopolysaccharide transport system permease protein
MNTSLAAGEQPVHIIRPRHGWAGFGLRELWDSRELIYFMAWRTILVRYKQTVLGVAWAGVQPLMLMVVLSLFFSSFARKAGVPGPIFFFAGLVPWTFFANSVTQSSNSLVGNANLLSKVYFPRMVAPIAALLATLVDFVVAFSILLGMMGWYGIAPRWAAVGVVPALVLLTLVTALGVGFWLSALNVAYRDVQYVVPFLVQIGLFASGVAFNPQTISEPWRTLLGINPMVGVIEGFRWALLGASIRFGGLVAISTVVAVVLLGSGLLFFRRQERSFADVV